MTESPAGPARHPKSDYIVAVLIAAVISVIAVTGSVWASEPSVTVIVDGDEYAFRSGAGDVAALLAEAGVEYSDSDLVTPAPDVPIADGLTVTVRHSVPVVLELADRVLELDVVGSTVGDALTAAGLDPTAGLTVEPPIDTGLTAGMTISASDVFVRVVREEADIDFDTHTIDAPDEPVGVTDVRTKGVPGRVVRVYRITVADGVEGERVLTAERVLRGPVAQVVAIGTKRVERQVTVSRGTNQRAPRSEPERPTSGREMVMESSAYVPGVGCGYTTASGAQAGRGVVAVDPSVIPLGTKLYIPGYGYAVAADTGGAIKGSRIDLCFESLDEALSWGRRAVTVTIVE